MSNFLIDRVKSLIFYPGYEWKVITLENRSLKEDFFNYSLTLIFIGGVAQMIGSFFFVRNVLDIDAYRFSFPLLKALSYMIMQIITIFFLTFLIHGVALRFGSEKNFVKSGKLVIYSLTPFLTCYILPNIDKRMILAMIPAFYSIYLFYKGLGIILKTPKHRAPAFLFIIILSTLGINYLLEMGFAFLITLFFPDII